jgi:hypothetical protein
MKILFKIVVVLLVLFLEIVLLEVLFPEHGEIAASYRLQERSAAVYDYRDHPSAETKAKLREELHLMHKHEDWKGYLALGVFFAVNGVWIYFYFRGRRRPIKSLATAAAPASSD